MPQTAEYMGVHAGYHKCPTCKKDENIFWTSDREIPDSDCSDCIRRKAEGYDRVVGEIESLAVEMETDDRAGKLAHWIVSLRRIAGEEAK